MTASIVAVLVSGQLVAFAMFRDRDALALETAHAQDAFVRLAAAASAIETGGSELEPLVLDVAGSPALGLGLSSEPLARGMGIRPIPLDRDIERGQSETGRRFLLALLPVAVAEQNAAWGLSRLEAVRAAPGPDGGTVALLVSVSLADGRWLNGRSPILTPGTPWDPRLLSLLAVTFVGLAVLVWFVVWRLAGPMDRMAESAGRLERGEGHEAVPLTGPREVRRVISRFNAMAERLTRLHADRARMLAGLAHDLRSPLTVMRIRIETLDDEEARERLVASIEEMQALVEDALAMARTTAGWEAPTRYDPAELLRELAAEMAERGETAALSEPMPSVPIIGRREAIRRALRNVAENAVRYGDIARISLDISDEGVVVRIDDDGPGIPVADRDRVFDPLVRLESSRSKGTGGSGLGLAIARAAVAADGGMITLGSCPGGGARATITLPGGTD